VIDETEFWNRVHAAARKANRAYLATLHNGGPKVRVVFPAFENRSLWIATQPNSPKAKQIRRDPRVELFFEVGTNRPITHLAVTGTARFVDDLPERSRVWNAKLFGYDLTEFWPRGPSSEDFSLLLVTPQRIELGTQPQMWQGRKPEIWKIPSVGLRSHRAGARP
jgi:general stress protein 26